MPQVSEAAEDRAEYLLTILEGVTSADFLTPPHNCLSKSIYPGGTRNGVGVCMACGRVAQRPPWALFRGSQN